MLAGFCAGCAEPAAPHVQRAPATPNARPWPAADRLFRSDPRWLGGDAAVSIPLDEQRMLWLFGDSFVAREPGQTRSEARLVHNSVALQHGRDPARAEIAFYAGAAPDGQAAAFFPAPGGGWFWPGHGIVLDGALTVFLERMRPDSAPGGLGFRSAGWTALRARDVMSDPREWQFEPLPVPDTGALGLVGVAVLLEGDFVYAYAVREPGDHAIMLLRWPRAAFTRGDLRQPQYFLGPGRGFGAGPPAVVMDEGATEFSVSRTPAGSYVEVQSRGFGAVPIAVRFARSPSGPFSPLRDVYRPDEAALHGVLLYAARAHPELEDGQGDLILTYASNTLEPQRVLGDLRLYVPRFVRLAMGERRLNP